MGDEQKKRKNYCKESICDFNSQYRNKANEFNQIRLYVMNIPKSQPVKFN